MKEHRLIYREEGEEMEYKEGNIFTFPDGRKGVVAKASNNIIGGQELDIDVNGTIKYVYIDTNGNVKEC